MKLQTTPIPANDVSASLIEPGDHPRFAAVNSQPFGYRHRLHLDPIFNLDAVRALADRLPDGGAFKSWQNGIVAIDGNWDTRPADWLTLAETLGGIATNNSLVVLKHVEQDEVFGPVLRDLLQEVFQNAPPAFQRDVVIGECLIFVNSPGRKTSYHFDLETSFLLQIEGEKTVYAWPCDDATLVPNSELEDYCGAGNLSAAIYKEDRQPDAQEYTLRPGDGVHFPSTGPHWVQNGDSVSISVNVNFDLRSLHRRAKYVHAINHRMRKLGLQPIEPGVSRWTDSLKAGTWQTAREIKRAARVLLGRHRIGEDYPVWRPQR